MSADEATAATAATAVQEELAQLASSSSGMPWSRLAGEALLHEALGELLRDPLAGARARLANWADGLGGLTPEQCAQPYDLGPARPDCDVDPIDVARMLRHARAEVAVAEVGVCLLTDDDPSPPALRVVALLGQAGEQSPTAPTGEALPAAAARAVAAAGGSAWAMATAAYWLAVWLGLAPTPDLWAPFATLTAHERVGHGRFGLSRLSGPSGGLVEHPDLALRPLGERFSRALTQAWERYPEPVAMRLTVSDQGPRWLLCGVSAEAAFTAAMNAVATGHRYDPRCLVIGSLSGDQLVPGGGEQSKISVLHERYHRIVVSRQAEVGALSEVLAGKLRRAGDLSEVVAQVSGLPKQLEDFLGEQVARIVREAELHLGRPLDWSDLRELYSEPSYRPGSEGVPPTCTLGCPDAKVALVVGAAGIGKTVIGWLGAGSRNEQAARAFAGGQADVETVRFATRLPAVELAQLDPHEPLSALWRDVDEPLAALLAEKAAAGHALVVIEELERVSPSDRSRFEANWSALCAAMPHGCLWLMARPSCADWATRLPGVEHLYHVLPHRYLAPPVRAWYAADEAKAGAFTAFLHTLPHPTQELLHHPLYLRMACQLPQGALTWRCRGELYEAFVQNALALWRQRADLADAHLAEADLRRELEALALVTWQADGANALGQAALDHATQRQRDHWRPTHGRDLGADLSDTGLVLPSREWTTAREGIFVHGSLGDYLAGCRLRAQGLATQRGVVQDAAWRPADQEALVFAAGRHDQPEVFLDWLGEDDDLFHHRLALQARGMAEALPGRPELQRATAEVAARVLAQWAHHALRGTLPLATALRDGLLALSPLPVWGGDPLNQALDRWQAEPGTLAAMLLARWGVDLEELGRWLPSRYPGSLSWEGGPDGWRARAADGTVVERDEVIRLSFEDACARLCVEVRWVIDRRGRAPVRASLRHDPLLAEPETEPSTRQDGLFSTAWQSAWLRLSRAGHDREQADGLRLLRRLRVDAVPQVAVESLLSLLDEPATASAGALAVAYLHEGGWRLFDGWVARQGRD